MVTTAIDAQIHDRRTTAAPRGLSRVVYVAGSGHTGSTLLALLMNAHPAMASVGEIAIKPKIRHKGTERQQKCSCGAFVGECTFWCSIFDRVRRQGLEFGPANWTNDYRLTNPVLHRVFTRESSHRIVRTLRGLVERRLPAYRERIRRIDRVNVAFVRAVLDTTGADVFVDTSKGPLRLQRLLEIPEFDVRVVTLVRDVRGYAASARRRGKSLSAGAESWKRDQLAIRAIVSTLPPDRKLLVRYEDLCADAGGTLERLCQFCGVAPMDVPAQLFSQDHHVLGNNMRMAGPIVVRVDERWRGEMNESDQRQVLRIAGDLHHEFGYLP